MVDAQEGPMPQTKFVLQKSLELGLKPIVVINKIDKPAARPAEVEEMVYELFLDLGANDEQLDFPVIYTIAKQGLAGNKASQLEDNLNPLLDLILKQVKPAASQEDIKKPLVAQIFNLAYDNFLGRLAVARIYRGKIKVGQTIFKHDLDNGINSGRVAKLFSFQGLVRQEMSEASAGDIVLIAGLSDAYIGETISEKKDETPWPAITIAEPTISLSFLINNSPFAGRKGNL